MKEKVPSTTLIVLFFFFFLFPFFFLLSNHIESNRFFFPASLSALEGLIKRSIVCLSWNAQRALPSSTSFHFF